MPLEFNPSSFPNFSVVKKHSSQSFRMEDHVASGWVRPLLLTSSAATIKRSQSALFSSTNFGEWRGYKLSSPPYEVSSVPYGVSSARYEVSCRTYHPSCPLEE